ncbi:unnamed protein product, partial [Brassica oleracea]
LIINPKGHRNSYNHGKTPAEHRRHPYPIPKYLHRSTTETLKSAIHRIVPRLQFAGYKTNPLCRKEVEISRCSRSEPPHITFHQGAER